MFAIGMMTSRFELDMCACSNRGGTCGTLGGHTSHCNYSVYILLVSSPSTGALVVRFMITVPHPHISCIARDWL